MTLNAETTERNKSRYRGLVPFPKGKSGNPGGRTKQFAQCQRLCREASPDAARRLIELIQSEDERVALMGPTKSLSAPGVDQKSMTRADQQDDLSAIAKAFRRFAGRALAVARNCGLDRWYIP
jgi:hypothetical protein